MKRPLAFLVAACALGPAVAAQDARDAVAFRADFSGPSRPVPPGLASGINDLVNASEGCWRAYAKAVKPRGGLARIWIKYHRNGYGRQHVVSGQWAKEAGMDVFLTVFGSPHQEELAGLGQEHAVDPPPDLDEWVEMVLEDVQDLRKQGVPVTHVEIWNEPDLPPHWSGTAEEFAQFFAAAGKRLRARLPADVLVGGPGMAAGYGGGRRNFEALMRRCADLDFKPDFLSWHDYIGYPTDQAISEIPSNNLRLAREYGLGEPELIISEWNINLPGPNRPKPDLDNHENAVYFVALNCGLAQTPLTHSLFFLLQDGRWDTKRDFAGESVGIFTINGAPKAVLSGMRMFRKASELPMVPLERRVAPANLAAMATREGDRGYVVVANSFGDAYESMRKYVESRGINLSDYKNKEDRIRRYLSGQIEFKALGAPEHHKAIWDEVRKRLRVDSEERKKEDREVVFELRGAPTAIEGVWIVDRNHGNPIANEDYMKAFEPYRQGNQAAMELTLESLEKQGVPESEVEAVQAAFKRGAPGAAGASIPGVPSDTERMARSAYRDALRVLQVEVPLELAAHPATFPAEAKSERWAKLDGSRLSVRVPPYTAVLVECRWDGSARKNEPRR